MKISFTEKQKRLLELCGVPSGLLIPFPINVNSKLQTIVEEVDGKIVCNFTIKRQQSTWELLAKLHLKTPHLIVFNSTHELYTLRRFVTPWFYNAVKHSQIHLGVSGGILPLWHYVDFSFNDALLDILLKRNQTISFTDHKPLLVLDGLSTDMGHNRLEKLRDILNLSHDHSILLILSGDRPYTFMRNKLGIEIEHLISFGATKNKQVL